MDVSLEMNSSVLDVDLKFGVVIVDVKVRGRKKRGVVGFLFFGIGGG